jgi:hypothetical protein
VCGEKLKVGDAVVSKPSRVGVRLFHDSCYESLFLCLDFLHSIATDIVPSKLPLELQTLSTAPR